MNILAIESSCDETAASVVRDGRTVLSDVVLSQADMHAVYGGVVPEIASRRHIEAVAGLADEALSRAGITKSEVDAIAVTYAPGLIGALLVGVNFAKAAAYALNVPLIPVHHLRGHIAANYLAFPELEPPFMCLVVSGGHSLIVDVRGYTDMEIIGSTRDDAAGEVFDKVARALGLGYPGGAAIDQLAAQGDESKYALPRAKVESCPYDMSFSGLKTAALNIINKANMTDTQVDANALAASFSAAVSDALIPRAVSAALESGRTRLAAAGGVAANSRIRRDLANMCKTHGLTLYVPPAGLCGDNAAMIGAQGYYEYLAGHVSGMDLNAFATREISAGAV